jgi:hypothetical protein
MGGIAFMKVQELAYQVAMRTIELLETTHHYKVPLETRKEIGQKILQELNEIIQRANKP